MRKFVKLFIFALLFLQFNQAYVEKPSYSDKTYVEKAILIEKYLVSHKNKIINFSKIYFLENDIEINKHLDRIEYLISSLNKVKNNALEEEKANLAILTILKEIKQINDILKVLLIEKKEDFDNKLNAKKVFY